MIISFRHKGLKLFYEKGDASRLQPQHVNKIRLILTRLDAAKIPDELNVPGYGLHQLKGNMKDFWSVKVDKNFRIIFKVENDTIISIQLTKRNDYAYDSFITAESKLYIDENAEDVDYIDYH